MAKDSKERASGPSIEYSPTIRRLLERLQAKEPELKSLKEGAAPEQAGGLTFPWPEVLIIIATEDENKHILDDRLKGVKREPSPLTEPHQKCKAEHIELPCGQQIVKALLVNLVGRGEARACAVLQRLLWKLSLIRSNGEHEGTLPGNKPAQSGLPGLIVNLGISATMNKDVRLADVVIAETLERYLEDATVEDLREDKDDPKKITGYGIEPRRVTDPEIDKTFANSINSLLKNNVALLADWRKECKNTINVCDLVRESEAGEIKTARQSLRDANDAIESRKVDVEFSQGKTAIKSATAKLGTAQGKLQKAAIKLAKAKAIHNPLAYRVLSDAGVVTRMDELKPISGIIMSGPLMVDSSRFKAKIAGARDNFLALDMESGGIAWAWQEIPVDPKPRLLILRGISDYGDGTKKGTDAEAAENVDDNDAKARALSTVAKGAIRKIAMLRAWDLMICLLGGGIHGQSTETGLIGSV